MLKKRKLVKIFSLCLISSFLLNTVQGVSAVVGEKITTTTETTAPPAVAGQENRPEHHESSSLQSLVTPVSSVAVNTLSVLGFPRVALAAGCVVALSEISREGGTVHDSVIRPLINIVKRIYNMGQNPFKDPDQIHEGILKVCSDFHLSEENQKILWSFAGPIINQLRISLDSHHGVLPPDFHFENDRKKSTVRCLYLIGEPGSGKSTLALALSKAFLKDPDDLLTVQPGSISSGEDAAQALFVPHTCMEEQYHKTAVHVKRPITLTEQISNRYGRAVVVFDDYSKYQSDSIDLAMFNLYDHGQINSMVGVLDCPAVIVIITSNESGSEFGSTRREVTKKAKDDELADVEGEKLKPTSKTIRKEIGHPEGFQRRVKMMELKRLTGSELKEALKKKFDGEIACGHKLILNESALDKLTALNTNDDHGESCAFDFSPVETAVSDFFHYNHDLHAGSNLEIDFEEGRGAGQFKIKESEISEEPSDVDSELSDGDDSPSLPVKESANFFTRFVIGYGLDKIVSNIGQKIKSALCCCPSPKSNQDQRLPVSHHQHHQQSRNKLLPTIAPAEAIWPESDSDSLQLEPIQQKKEPPAPMKVPDPDQQQNYQAVEKQTDLAEPNQNELDLDVDDDDDEPKTLGPDTVSESEHSSDVYSESD